MAARNDSYARRDYSSLTPRLVPDFFFLNKRCQIAVIYDEDLGETSRDTVTLMFSGGHSGAAPIRVVPERVGTRTLLLQSPVYSKAPPTGTVSVLPILHTKQSTGHEDVDLKSFEIKVNDPARNLIQMCLQVFPSEEMLPVFITLMLRCKRDRSAFQDPQFDQVMATLVANRDPQSSSNSIKDILRPAKKWQRMTLHEFCKEHSLPNAAEASKESRQLRKKSIALQPAKNEQDLQAIYANIHELRPSPAKDGAVHSPQSDLYENTSAPSITVTPKSPKSTYSSTSLEGEPINLNNPPSHYLNPPGSGTESDSEAYGNLRTPRAVKSHYSDTDTSPPTKPKAQRQQCTDSMDSGLNRIHLPYHPKKSPHGRQQTAGHAPSTTGWSPLMQHTAISHQPHNIPQPLPRQPHVSGRAHHRDYTSTSGGERGPQPEHRPTPPPRHNLAKVNQQTPVQQTIPVPSEISNTADDTCLYDDVVHTHHQTDVPRPAVLAAAHQSGSSYRGPQPMVPPRRLPRQVDKTGIEAKQW